MRTFFTVNNIRPQSKILLEKMFTDILTKIDDIFDEVKIAEEVKKPIIPINGTVNPPKRTIADNGKGPVKAYNLNVAHKY
jgi:hypothetical protein